MVRSLYNGVSGVRTQGFSMDVWANNIANINNVGFTASIPESDAGPSRPGRDGHDDGA